MRKISFCLLFIFFICMPGCSNRSYEDGYSAGYDAGYQAALNSTREIAVESTAPSGVLSNTYVLQPEPKSGYIFEDITDFDCLAPLSIETTGDGGYYFVIDPLKFPAPHDDEAGKIYADIMAKYSYFRLYIRAGSTVNIDLPLGEYEVYYAHGSSWYGEEDLFGPETVYYKCDDTFLFEETATGYNGWTISLALTPNGNLDTDLISESDFPKSAK